MSIYLETQMDLLRETLDHTEIYSSINRSRDGTEIIGIR